MLKTKVLRIISVVGITIGFLGIILIFLQKSFGLYVSNHGLLLLCSGGVIEGVITIYGFKADKFYVKSLLILILLLISLIALIFVISRIVR